MRLVVPVQDSRLEDLKPEEFRALRESIREHGQLVPILVSAAGEVVDGRHRLRICAELGIEPRFMRLDEAADIESVGLVVNVARRHLTVEARRGLAEFELAHDPERSDGLIASQVGLSHTTVGKVRRDLEARRRIRRVDTRTGRNGVVQPARKPARPRRPGKPQLVIPCPAELAHELAPALEPGGSAPAAGPFVGAWVACSVRVARRPAGYELELRRTGGPSGARRSKRLGPTRGPNAV